MKYNAGTVLKFTEKYFKKNPKLLVEDKNARLIVLDKTTCFWYNAETNEVIEPFAFKSQDSHVTSTNESYPKKFKASKNTYRMSGVADWEEVKKQLKIEIEIV